MMKQKVTKKMPKIWGRHFNASLHFAGTTTMCTPPVDIHIHQFLYLASSTYFFIYIYIYILNQCTDILLMFAFSIRAYVLCTLVRSVPIQLQQVDVFAGHSACT